MTMGSEVWFPLCEECNNAWPGMTREAAAVAAMKHRHESGHRTSIHRA